MNDFLAGVSATAGVVGVLWGIHTWRSSRARVLVYISPAEWSLPYELSEALSQLDSVIYHLNSIVSDPESPRLHSAEVDAALANVTELFEESNWHNNSWPVESLDISVVNKGAKEAKSLELIAESIIAIDIYRDKTWVKLQGKEIAERLRPNEKIELRIWRSRMYSNEINVVMDHGRPTKRISTVVGHHSTKLVWLIKNMLAPFLVVALFAALEYL
ncbi:MAG: hypothetical protein AAGG55_02855 [Pseudomonadota bacterium]